MIRYDRTIIMIIILITIIIKIIIMIIIITIIMIIIIIIIIIIIRVALSALPVAVQIDKFLHCQTDWQCRNLSIFIVFSVV